MFDRRVGEGCVLCCVDLDLEEAEEGKEKQKGSHLVMEGHLKP